MTTKEKKNNNSQLLGCAFLFPVDTMLLPQQECLLQITDLRKSWSTSKFPVKSSFPILSPCSLVHRERRLSPTTPQAVTMELYACNLHVCPTDNCKQLQGRQR